MKLTGTRLDQSSEVSAGTGIHLCSCGRSITLPLTLNEICPSRSAERRLFTGITQGSTAASSSSLVDAFNMGSRASNVLSCPFIPVHAIERAAPWDGSPSTTGPRGVEPRYTSKLPSPRITRSSTSHSTASRASVSTKRSVSSAIPWVMHQATVSL